MESEEREGEARAWQNPWWCEPWAHGEVLMESEDSNMKAMVSFILLGCNAALEAPSNTLASGPSVRAAWGGRVHG
jgi:hypothetical protein